MISSNNNLIAIDVGNTSIVLGYFESGQLRQHVRLTTNRTLPQDEWLSYFTAEFANLGPVQNFEVIVTSVVPDIDSRLTNFFRGKFAMAIQFVTHQSKLNFSIRVEKPEQVGTDRFVDAAAAVSLYGPNVIVIDMGTATTIDCVCQGVFEGGIILPGLEISAQALLDRTSKLFRVNFQKPPNILGKNTEQCLQSGLSYGYASMLDGLIDRITQQCGVDMPVVSTGGLSRLMLDVSSKIDHFDEHLTLKGLKLIHDLNR